MEESEALARLKQGDLTGLEELVRRYQQRAVYSAYLIVQQADLAEEIAQEGFIKLISKIKFYDESRPFSPWFFRIIINDSIKCIKRQARFTELPEEGPPQSLLSFQSCFERDENPELQVEKREEIATLRKCMRALNAEQRAVIVMKYYLNLHDDGLANQLNQPLSTVKWWLRTARKKLKMEYKTATGEE